MYLLGFSRRKSFFELKSSPRILSCLLLIVRLIGQDDFIILAAIEEAKDGNLSGLLIRFKGNDGALFVVGYAQSGPHVFARSSTNRKGV